MYSNKPLLLAAGIAMLVGCTPTYKLEGTISGLSGDLVISDGNQHTITLSTNGTFSFSPATYKKGDAYEVVIQQQPDGQECRVANYHGAFTSASIKNVEIVCSTPGTVVNACASPANTTVGSYKLTDTQVALGSGLGASGFSTFDSDDDGYPEFLFGSGSGFGANTHYAMYEYDSNKATYQPVCSRNFTDAFIRKIIPFQNEQFNAASLIALDDGTLEVINHRSGEILASINSTLNDITDVAIGDADNDGADEIVVLSASNMLLFDANTFVPEQSIAEGGTSIALGHFTSTQKIQIALNKGLVIELNGTEQSVIWNYTTLGFSNNLIRAGNLDNDGLDEIAGADSWYQLRVFNADTHGLLWQANSSHDIDALQIADTDNDGAAEVLYGDGQWGGLHALGGATGTLLWTAANSGSGVTDLLVQNLDDDASLELLWGTGHSSTGPDYLFIQDITTNTPEWRSGETGGPYFAIAFGDLDGDTIPDRIHASFESESGYGDGIVRAISSATGELLWETTSNTFGGHAWTGVHALAVLDVNDDGINDVLAGTDLLYDGYVYALNGVDGSVLKSVALEDGSPIYSLTTADIDADGDMEILAGGGMEHTGANGIFVYVIDAETFQWQRTLPGMGNGWDDVWATETVDFNNDGQREVIALQTGVFIIDTLNNGIDRTVATNFSAIAVAGNRVFAGDSDGNLREIHSNAISTLIQSLCSDGIFALEAIDNDQLAFTCGGRLGVYELSSQSTEWQLIESIDVLLGYNDSLRHAVIDGRSALQVGGSSVYYFLK